MTPNCYYKVMGDVVGPISTDEVRSLAARGIIERDTPMRVGEHSEWFPASRVKNLFTATPPVASRQAVPSIAPPAPPPRPTVAVEPAGRDGAAGGHSIHTDVPVQLRGFLRADEDVLFAGNLSSSVLILSLIIVGIFVGLPGLFAAYNGELSVAFIVILSTGAAMIAAYLNWRNQFYLVTNRRTITKQGTFNVAIKILPNHNIQLISINTGFIDRLLGLNRIELSSAAAGNSGGVLRFFSGLAAGGVVLRYVDVDGIMPLYDN